MSYETYKILHLAGLMLVFAGLGGLLYGARGEGAKAPLMATVFHGLGMLVMLVAGFGILARLNLDVASPWVLVKLGIWVVFGAAPILIKKRVLPLHAQAVVYILLGVLAGYFAIFKSGAF